MRNWSSTLTLVTLILCISCTWIYFKYIYIHIFSLSPSRSLSPSALSCLSSHLSSCRRRKKNGLPDIPSGWPLYQDVICWLGGTGLGADQSSWLSRASITRPRSVSRPQARQTSLCALDPETRQNETIRRLIALLLLVTPPAVPGYASSLFNYFHLFSWPLLG